MMPDDMRIPDSYEVAKDMGMDFVMKNKNIKGAHPNTAQIIMEAEGVPQMKSRHIPSEADVSASVN